MAPAVSIDAGMRQKLNSVRFEITKVLAQVLDDPDAPLILLRDRVMDILRDAGLIYKQKLHSRFVGVHPKNRYENGIIPASVITLLLRIFAQGFSERQLDHPTAVECPPIGHSKRKNIISFNVKCMADSLGRLPAYEDNGEMIKILSATCGHTSQGLRCLWHGVECDESSSLAPNGHLSLDVMKMQQPKYALAASEGIEWDIVHWQVEDEFPAIMDLFQQAGNQRNMLSKGESRLEVLMKMHAAAKRRFNEFDKRHDGDDATSAEVEELWESVRKVAMRGNPPFYEEIGDLLDFVRYLSGGMEDPIYLHVMRDFIRTLKVERQIKGPMWGVASRVRIGAANAAPSLRIACLWAMAGASDTYGVGEEQTLLTTADIQALGSKHLPHALAADEMLLAAEAILKLHAEENVNAMLIFYVLAIRIVHHIFRKEDPARGVFHTMAAIGHTFCIELATLLQKPIQSPWSGSKGTVVASSVPRTSAKSAVVEFADGAVQNSERLLLAKGYEVGGYAFRIADKTRFKIIVLDAQVHMEDDLGESLYVRSGAMLGGGFRPMKAEKEIVHIHDWFKTSEPSQSLDWQLEVAAAKVKLAVHDLHGESLRQLEDLEIVVAPILKKGVWTKREFAPRELKLFPLTPNVVMKAASEKAPASAVDLGLLLRDPRTDAEKKVCSGTCIYPKDLYCKRMSELVYTQCMHAYDILL